MSRNYLVTGAAGFIGSAVAKKLITLGNTVWTIDNLSTGNRLNLPKKINFIKGNCESSSILKKIKDIKFNAILHFAGQSSGEISFENPTKDLLINTGSTLNLLNFAKKNGCKRFIYASSMSVYGKTALKPIKENHACEPQSFYGISKLASEKYLDLYSAMGINVTSIRLFNVYGPQQNLTNLKQGMVSIYLAQLLKNKSIQVKGSLKRFRDFIFIDDVVNLTIKIIKNKKSFGKKINFGTGKKTTVKQLISIIKKNYKKKFTYTVKGNTPGDQFGIYANNSLVKKFIGYNKFTSLEKGIITTLKWLNSD